MGDYKNYSKNFGKGGEQKMDIPDIDLDKIEPLDITKKIKNFSTWLGNNTKFSSNQLRKYYSQLKLINEREAKRKEIQLKLAMFLSKLEYGYIKITDKSAKKGFEDFKKFLTNLIEKNLIGEEDDERFKHKLKNFMLIAESLVAYFPKNK